MGHWRGFWGAGIFEGNPPLSDSPLAIQTVPQTLSAAISKLAIQTVTFPAFNPNVI